nr:hypothetical protein [Candidatus Paceibacterota bacterium]
GLNQWGGAIRVPGGFMSFSGFSEETDDDTCLRLAVVREILTVDEALALKSLHPTLDTPRLSGATLRHDIHMLRDIRQ